MRRARRAAAWAVGLLAIIVGCVPPDEPQKPKPTPKPATAAAVEPDAVYAFSPQRRRNFATDEMAELTVVVATTKALPEARLTVALRDAERTTWATTDVLGALPAGRHTLAYGIEVGQFPVGDYTLTAAVNGQAAEPMDVTFVSAVPETHFPIAGMIEKPPRHARDAARWGRALGLNTVLLQGRSPWGANGTLPEDFATLCESVRASETAEPLERRGEAPPFTRTADLLTGAGLRWVNCCAVSGGGQPYLQPDRSLADAAVVRGGRQRIHHRMIAERAFARFAGVHFSEEGTLALHRAATYQGPFGAPARLAAYREATGAEGVPWQQGAQWEGWQGFVTWRAGVVGRALANWSAAVRAVEPGAVATSQLYWPTRLGEGVWPPQSGQGLGVLTVQAGLDGPAGMMMPAVATDLFRMGNWDKRLWFMPELSGEAELDEVRTALSLALARKIEGVVYPPSLDYHLDRPGAGSLPLQLVEGVGGLNVPLTRLGDFFQALEKPRHDVAILYSVTEHAARIGQNPAKDPRAADYPRTLITAYEACVFGHFAPTFLTEAELLAGEGARSRVILVVGVSTMRPEVKAKLESLAAGEDVIVLKSLSTEVAIEGAYELPLRFPDLQAYHEDLWRKGEEQQIDTTLERRDEVAQAKLIYEDLGRLRKRLKEFIERDYTVSDKTVLICDQRAGAGRYLFVVNNEQRTDIFRGLKWEPRPSKTRVTLRPVEGGYKAYDVFAGERVFVPRVDGYPVLDLVLPAGGVDCIALLPKLPQGVYIQRARLRDGAIELKANVHAAEEDKSKYLRVPLDAAVPIEVIVRDGEGNVLHHLYRAHTPEGYEETIPVPALAEPGQWTVEVRETLSGETAEATVEVGPRTSVAWLRRRGRVATFAGDRIAGLLRSDQPLWIVVGTAQEAKAAEPLAQTLGSAGREVAVKLAADVAKPRSLDPAAAPTYVSAGPDNQAMPDIRQPAILLGNAATHPLIQAVARYGLLPRSLSPDHPGPGGALLCWQVSTFEPDVETIVAAATDAAGVQAAVAALRQAAGGRPLQTAWRPVPGAPPQPDTRIVAQPKELEARWSKDVLDDPVAIDLPPGGQGPVVGFFHGQVIAYDVIGKALWHHWTSSRCRDVAASLDGAWTAYASFPEVGYLTARGRPQWAVPLEESSYRADHTAVAMSLRGEVTVAGTRDGIVKGLSMDGHELFVVGEEDADERAEGRQSRFGTVHALAVSPRAEAVVVAGEKEVAAFDRTGEQLWNHADLRRVIALAMQLAEEPMVALGSRDGYVVLLGPQGRVAWRAPTEGYVTSVSFRGKEAGVLAACLDGTVTCYNEKGKVLWRRRSPVGYRHVASALDGELTAAAELAGRVELIDVAGSVVARTPPLPGVIRVLALSPDGTAVIVGTSADRLWLFRYRRPRPDEDIL